MTGQKLTFWLIGTVAPQVISKLWRGRRGGGAVGSAALTAVSPGGRQHDEAAH